MSTTTIAPAQAHDPAPSPMDESFQTAPSSPESTNTLLPPSNTDPLLTPSGSPSPSSSSSLAYPFSEKPRARVASIKFAPLPAIDPSKKRNHIVPLGVNARSRRRRDWQNYHDGNGATPSLFAPPPMPPMQMPPPQQPQPQRVSLWEIDYEDEEEEEERTEDPIVVFGRMLKDTSVSLWKRVASRRRGERRPQQQQEQHPEGGEQNGQGEVVLEIRRAADEGAAPEKERERDFDVITITETEGMPVLPLLDVDIAKSLSALGSDDESQEGEAEEDKAACRKRRQSCPDTSRPSSPFDGSRRRKSWSASAGDTPPVPVMPLPPLPPLPVLTFSDF